MWEATIGSHKLEEHFITPSTHVFLPLALSVRVEAMILLCPNERVLSYEAVRLPHTVNVTKERISVAPRADKRNRQSGGGVVCRRVSECVEDVAD